MNKDIQSKAEQLNKKRRRRGLWYRILSVPICIVVFVTTYAMILPAITLESTPDTYCGMTEHVHDENCYEVAGAPERTEIKCPVQQALHTHTDECFDEQGALICEEADYIIHEHDSFCFDAAGELICTIAEAGEHVHTDECYDENSRLICGKTKGIAHNHTADCLVTIEAVQPQGLICEISEHRHTEECFIETDAPDDAPAQQDLPEEDAAELVLENLAISISDDVSASGCFTASVTDNDGQLDARDYKITWYKSTDGGATYTKTENKAYTIGGATVNSIDGEHEQNVNLVLDGGAVSESRSSVKYKAVLTVDGVEYEEVSAELENAQYTASLLNGSFENPDLTNHQYQEFVPEGTAGLYWKTTGDNVEGSGSGEDKQHVYGGGTAEYGKHYIEIVDTSGDLSNSNSHKYQATNWHGQGSASEGKQYAEINAGAAGALYQTVMTVPGTTMHWSVDHSGRAGTDTMAVVVMSEELAKNIKTQDQLLAAINNIGSYAGAQATTGLTAPQGVWVTHSGTYTVPEGQYLTRYFFVAISTANNKAYIGNHVDNAWFSQKIPPAPESKPYFNLKKTLTGDLTAAEVDALLNKLTFEIQRSSNSDFTNPETVTTISAKDYGEFIKNDDGTWTLSAKIDVSDTSVYPRNRYYYRMVEKEESAQLDGHALILTDDNGAVQITASTKQEYSFINAYSDAGKALTLKKIVNASNTTGSFEFEITYTDVNGNAVTKTMTLKNGEMDILSDIKKGAQVTIVETNSKGYTVTMKDNDEKLLSDSNSYTFTMMDDAYIVVNNTTSVLLPETGGTGTYVFVYGGLGIMLAVIIIGYILRRRYGKEDD